MPRPKRITIAGVGYNIITRDAYNKAKVKELARLREAAINRIIIDFGVIGGVDLIYDTATKHGPDGSTTVTKLVFHRYRLGPNIITPKPFYLGVSVASWERTATNPDGTITTTSSKDRVAA